MPPAESAALNLLSFSLLSYEYVRIELSNTNTILEKLNIHELNTSRGKKDKDDNSLKPKLGMNMIQTDSPENKIKQTASSREQDQTSRL